MRSRSARRYAQALWELADAGERRQIAEELMLLAATLERYPQLEKSLIDPLVSAERKLLALSELFPGLSELTQGTLKTLARDGALGLIRSLERDFQRRFLASQGVVVAEVTSASELPQEVYAELERRLSRSGAQVRIEPRVDPRVLGGVKVKVGDLVVDGTAKTQLNKLRRELLEAL